MEKKYTKNCVECQKEFMAFRHCKKFCSEKCMREYNKKHSVKRVYPRIDEFSFGTIWTLKNMDEPMENWVWTLEIRTRKDAEAINTQVMTDKLIPKIQEESEEVDYAF